MATHQPTQPMPELSIDQGHHGRFTGFAIMVIISGIAVVLFAVFMYLYNLSLKNQIADLSSQKANLLSQIQTPENQKIEETINSAAAVVGQLSQFLDTKGYKTGNFLDDFPKVVNKSAQINNLVVDKSGSVKMDGTAKSQAELAQLMQSLQDAKFIKNVQLAGSSIASGSVSFSLSAELDKGLPVDNSTAGGANGQ